MQKHQALCIQGCMLANHTTLCYRKNGCPNQGQNSKQKTGERKVKLLLERLVQEGFVEYILSPGVEHYFDICRTGHTFLVKGYETTVGEDGSIFFLRIDDLSSLEEIELWVSTAGGCDGVVKQHLGSFFRTEEEIIFEPETKYPPDRQEEVVDRLSHALQRALKKKQ